MANIKRSIWEIRFYALKQAIQQERENIQFRIYQKAIKNEFSVEDRDIAKAEINQIEYLEKLARELTATKANFIYLERDY